MGKKFTLRAEEGAFAGDATLNNISTTPQPYDKKIADATKLAEELDRYDDFGFLKIKPSAYEKTDATGEYGIPRSHIHDTLNSASVILSHQQNASLSFLRELRGFGLLADVVGSGKTFEACAILSELASRGKINSMLLVVPEQTYEMWKDVLELKFGLGKGIIAEYGEKPIFANATDTYFGDKTLKRPNAPIIVKTQDFAKWDTEVIKNILFDVIVVDEAHHLCVEGGEYAKALKLLSAMMITKKLANSTYCILLSATPHSGNLSNMFRLWYFIRCKGGEPSDFDDKDDSARTYKYNSEKQYYLNTVCRGASTVAEYIAVSKKYEIEGVGGYVPKIWAQYREFLLKKLNCKASDLFKAYAGISEAEKRIIRETWLNQNPALRAEVLGKVAMSYHNSVMRSIMIRQPNKVPKSRAVKNYYFYPVNGLVPEGLQLKYENTGFSVDCSNLYKDDAVYFDGMKKSLPQFARFMSRDNLSYVSAEITVSKILGALGSFNDQLLFDKKNSLQYYWEQLQNSALDPSCNNFVIYNNKQASVYDQKVKKLVEILSSVSSERALIFFDYDLTRQDADRAEWIRLKNTLQQDYPDIYKRVIYASANNADDELTLGQREEFVKQFKNKEDAIMIIGDASFTEGVNLQDSRIIINFQVTPDPLSMDQRIGRVFRLGQTRDVSIISFAAMNKLEGYSLAYFNRIGLLSSVNGDATIIAGSNNEHMVAVQCPSCKRVALYSEMEYVERKKKGLLNCIVNESCRKYDSKGTEMQEINVYEFKCDKCGITLSRGNGDEGYRCFATNNASRGKLYNSAESGNRTYSCSKLCVMQHCKMFKENLKDKCLIMKKYGGKTVPNITELQLLCLDCPHRGIACPEQCSMLHDSMEESLRECRYCNYAECKPKPHTLVFDKKWTTDCPKDDCSGRLRPIVSKTFATYIRASYAFNDGGESFCKNFLDEAKKTDDIRQVLERDAKSN